MKVAINRECEKLRQKKTPLPNVTPDSDYRVLAAEAGARARDSDRKNNRYAECVGSVIDAYEKAGSVQP